MHTNNSASISPETPQWKVRQLDDLHIQKLHGFIRKRVSNQEDSEDLLQATLLEALRCEHNFNHASKPLTWLCGIALNLIRNFFRRAGNMPYQGSLEDLEYQNMEVHLEIDRQVDQYRQLVRAIDAIRTLPSNMREIMTLTIETDGSYLDTAQTLGVPVGTVRSRLSRAREQLKKTVQSGL